MDKFQFESGKTLENVLVEYVVTGTPKYDEEGKICNAVVYGHRFNGDCYSISDISDLTKEGAALDKNDYCFFSITSLGFPQSCSPSTTGLKYNFPTYSIADRVNFRRQFLKSKFGIEKVHGIVGCGIGGYEAYQWACDYPYEMDFIIVIDSSFKTNGYRHVLSRAFESIIDASDGFYSDIYNESLSKVIVSINKILYSVQFSKRMFQTLSNDEIDLLMEAYVDEGLFMDIYDFKFRNDSVLAFNVEDKLENIEAKTLVISNSADLYYTPEFDVVPLKKLIKNCTTVIFDSKNCDACVDAEFVDGDIKKFLYEFKK